MKKETVILGGGPSGLAAAYELHKYNKDFIVVEKEEKVGGLAKTLHFGDFSTDIGPHRFFSQTQYLYDMIDSMLGEKWNKVNRLTRFLMKGRYFLYPVDLRNVVTNLGIARGVRIVMDYLKQFFLNKLTDNEVRSFEDIAVNEFGRSLAELNMLNYTEKIWGLPCKMISADWFKQRIKGLSIRAILNDMLFKKIKQGEGPKTLVDQFYYPETGTSLIYESIVDRVSKDANGVVKTSSIPIKIKHDNNRILEVTIQEKGGTKSYEVNNLISSIPWNELLETFEPKPPESVMEAVDHLMFRSHVSVFITLDKEQVFKDQWLYFPEKEVPFGRMMEPKNFSEKLTPDGKTSLMVEYFCWEDGRNEKYKVWKLPKEKIFKLTIKWLEKMGFIREEEVINCYLHKEKYAYPVYDLFYKKYRDHVKDYLGQFKNLQLIGRAGNFRYNNQDHALEMGIISARSIIEGNQYDLEKIGTENKYFERGYISN
jgi:protoporphyrinogen oxidase